MKIASWKKLCSIFRKYIALNLLSSIISSVENESSLPSCKCHRLSCIAYNVRFTCWYRISSLSECCQLHADAYCSHLGCCFGTGEEGKNHSMFTTKTYTTPLLRRVSGSSGDLTYISLLIIPCIIYYVTNKETLNLGLLRESLVQPSLLSKNCDWAKGMEKLLWTLHIQHTHSLICYRLVDATELWAPCDQTQTQTQTQ